MNPLRRMVPQELMVAAHLDVHRYTSKDEATRNNSRVILGNFDRSVKDVQVFDFGQFETATFVDREMAAQLWSRKLLRLPFPTTLLTFKARGNRIYIFAKDDCEVQMQGGLSETGCTAFLLFTQHDARIACDAFVWFTVPDGEHVSAGATPLSDCPGETDETFRAYTLTAVARLMALCMVLNTKGIKKHTEPVPVKLNAKRARSGRSPLPSVTYIDVASLAQSAQRTGTGREMPMHFRRGHIRHYDDGTVTWVRDTIVKADGELKTRARYQVRGGGEKEDGA
jgi:hypothetical protein